MSKLYFGNYLSKFSPQMVYDDRIQPQRMEKARMLDSRMTEDELYNEKDNHSVHTTQYRNPRGAEHVTANAVLNNSYDDLRAKQKRRTATHRKSSRNTNIDVRKSSSRNHHKTHRKQRSISMRSQHKKPGILKSSRIISDSVSERSSTYRSRNDRSMSMSLRQDKTEFKDTLKNLKYEERYKQACAKAEKLQHKLTLERQNNHNMKREFDLLQKKATKVDKYQKKIKSVKKDYNELLDSFEKSEQIRKSQKDLINTLRAEIQRLSTTNDGKTKVKETMDTEQSRGKRKIQTKRKPVKELNKSTTRQKSKKPRKLRT